MHDPLYDRVEAGKALAPFPTDSAPTYAEMLRHGLEALKPLLPPIDQPDPVAAANRARYRMNRAERRAHDRAQKETNR